MTGGEHALAVASRSLHQRAVDRHHFVEKHRDIHRPRFRHAVIARPGAVVLVPLPDVAFERSLGVDLELMDIDVLAEQLPQRLDQPRMRCQETKCLVESMRSKGGARRARFLAPDLLAIELEDRCGVIAKERYFFLVEAVREEQIPEFVELFDLCGAERHGAFPRTWPWRFECSAEFTAKRGSVLRTAELRLALGEKSFHALAEIVGLAQPAVAMAFELNRGLQVGVFGRIQKRFRGALRQRRE